MIRDIRASEKVFYRQVLEIYATKLSDYKGKVILIVNTATGCGFTPHYKPLEEMYSQYHDQGLEIIDVPCNQFAGQTPGTDEEIHEFCTLNYHTEFPQMKKSDVNGENELALYTFLKSKKLYCKIIVNLDF